MRERATGLKFRPKAKTTKARGGPSGRTETIPQKIGAATSFEKVKKKARRCMGALPRFKKGKRRKGKRLERKKRVPRDLGGWGEKQRTLRKREKKR